ncbi:MAG: glucosaminidase domain-containing protein [Elusimicrobia bacterium]|nr:glucosaminidase domain-containing protein [Elusimicrobiota bacterium]MDE2236250.1 glucosaminidase domain-containing protein [Elusimicrobiota bacterium]MDE2426956.1 glucosaminidase domain-containing protein [Elusimicrobiota bacterium]
MSEENGGAVGGEVKKLAHDVLAPLDSQLGFVERFAPLDIAKSKAEGIPLVGIFTAWAAMESNFAESGLAKASNNLFGIKAGPTWIKEGKPYVTFRTREYEGTPNEVTITSNFRKYSSWTASLDDLIKELTTDFKTGGALQALQRGDVGGFLSGIEASGYSTAANYGQRIENFMQQIAHIA